MDFYKESLESLKKDVLALFRIAKKRSETWHDITPIENPWEKKYWLFLKDLLDKLDKYIKSKPAPRNGKEVIIDAMAYGQLTEFLDPKNAVSKYRNEMETNEFETLGIMILSVRRTKDGELYLDVSGAGMDQEQKLIVIGQAFDIVSNNGGRFN